MSARTTIPIAPGLWLDDSATASQGRFIACDKVRFRLGRPQTIGGWESVTTQVLSGKCRGLFSWRDNDDAFNIAMGTSEALYVNQGGDHYDITPTSGFTAGLDDGTGGQGFGTGAYSTGFYSEPTSSDYFPMTWSCVSYGQTLLANPRGQTVFQWSNVGTTPAVSLGRTASHTADFTSYADQTAFDVDYTRGTGWTFDAVNDEIDCDGSQAGDSDTTRSVTTVSGKYYRVEVTFTRTAGTIAALGASSVGETASASSGTVWVSFKAAGSSSTVGVRGDLDFAGTVTGLVVYALAAPDECTVITVPQNKRHLVVYGCNEEATDVYNPRAIRWSDFEDLTDWVTSSSNNAGEYVLEGSGAIVGAKEAPFGTFVWTTNDLWFQTYLGAPDQTYEFTRLGNNCGLIGPKAAVVFEGTAYWMAPDGSFWMAATGSPPNRIISPVQQDVSDNLAFVQQAKVYASSIAEFKEVWWHYPDSRDGNENSRYVSLEVGDQTWSGGKLARTAMIDAGAGPSPVAVDDAGSVYYHERGTSANGGNIEWSFETGDIRIASGGVTMMLRGLWCDVEEQRGLANLTVTTKMFPQGEESTSGPHTMAVGQDRVHLRASGNFMRLKFSGNAAPSTFRLGDINADLVTRGTR